MSDTTFDLAGRGGAAAAESARVGDFLQLLKPRVMSLVVFSGFAGMPRRIPDYPDAFAGWNHIASIGAYISFASTLWFVGVTLYTLFAGKRIAANPWGEGATTLEWTVTSPPPFHSYEELPVVK